MYSGAWTSDKDVPFGLRDVNGTDKHRLIHSQA